MTDHEALAQRAVKAGVLQPDNDGDETLYYPGCYDIRYKKQCEMAVTDGRVILAALRACRDRGLLATVTALLMVLEDGWDQFADPVAILTACLDALEGE